ncbi:hypothetical protein Hokovirus_1_316 [Hokovirus HKV1]|uniref:Uncharacterized protein n=1 Tax=Hokovirus HKV1 TaxID=1977638 RepID=A0A1V0SFE9_9VIRU|nr:hypothetical protein Hokovirus_1_316 [Hokovirus HKV1]
MQHNDKKPFRESAALTQVLTDHDLINMANVIVGKNIGDNNLPCSTLEEIRETANKIHQLIITIDNVKSYDLRFYSDDQLTCQEFAIDQITQKILSVTRASAFARKIRDIQNFYSNLGFHYNSDDLEVLRGLKTALKLVSY